MGCGPSKKSGGSGVNVGQSGQRGGGGKGPSGADYDFLFKLLLIGDAGVGKSSLLLRFADNTFTESFISTIGVDFKIRTLDIGGTTVKLQIWDTAGQERFRSVTRSYYRNAAGCILLYDITSRESYNHLSTWLNDARALSTLELVIVLVGNKSDRQEKREVTFLEASRFAQENDLLFVETSAKTGEGVEEVFLHCAKTILNKIESGIIKPEDLGCGIQVGTGARKRHVAPKINNAPFSTSNGDEVEKEDCAC